MSQDRENIHSLLKIQFDHGHKHQWQHEILILRLGWIWFLILLRDDGSKIFVPVATAPNANMDQEGL